MYQQKPRYDTVTQSLIKFFEFSPSLVGLTPPVTKHAPASQAPSRSCAALMLRRFDLCGLEAPLPPNSVNKLSVVPHWDAARTCSTALQCHSSFWRGFALPGSGKSDCLGFALSNHRLFARPRCHAWAPTSSAKTQAESSLGPSRFSSNQYKGIREYGEPPRVSAMCARQSSWQRLS